MKNNVLIKQKNPVLRLAIATALMTGYDIPHSQAGTCTGGPDNFVCSGPANTASDVEQNISGNPLNVITLPGFGVDTSDDLGSNAIKLSGSNGAGNVVFEDLNNSTISGHGTAILVDSFYSTGDLSITTSGPVSSLAGDGIGIETYYYFTGNVSVNASGTIMGSSDGIEVNNFGAGETNIFTLSSVSGGAGAGLNISNNYYTTTNLTIDAQGPITGQTNGIFANNEGRGLIDLMANAVTSTTDAGVRVLASNQVSSVSISTSGTVSGNGGIYSNNQGTGDHTITTQTVYGNNNRGIDAYNFYTADSMVINANGPVSGNNSGIRARNNGSGMLTITTSEVTSNTGAAIVADAFYTVYADVTILTQGTISGHGGIVSGNRGDGQHLITTGTVIGNAGTAIDVNNFYSVGQTEIRVQGPLSGAKGIEVTSQAYNDITITTESTVTTTNDDGIEVSKSTAGSGDISVTTLGALNVYQDGISISNAGGGISILAENGITSSNARGLYVTQGSNSSGEVVIITNDLISGSSVGIMVGSLTTNDITITASGPIQGGSDRGVVLYTQDSQNATVNLNAGSSLSQGMSDSLGDATVNVASGVRISGDLAFGDGSDELFINNSDFSGVTLFDGGDDAVSDDGFFDILRFQGAMGTLDASQVVNWESIVLDSGSHISIPGTHTLTTQSFQVATGATLSMQDGAADDDLTVTGFFTGGGTVTLDVVVSDQTPAADVLRINNPAINETAIAINNMGGLGGIIPGDGLLLVDMASPSPGTFVLSAPLHVNGYAYDLVQVGVDWYLQGVATDADVGITKDLLTPGPYVVGDTVTYELVISNDGPLDATNVVVSDQFTNLTMVSLSGGSCAPASFPCTIPSLPNGSSETLTVTATIDAVGAFDNVASVTADQPDANQANNIDNTGNGGVTLDQFDVGVTVTGLASGNGVELLNNGGDNLMVNSNNSLTHFSMPLNDGEDYLVAINTQPTMPNQTCVFTSANSGTVNGADVTDITLACTTNTYFIGGEVTGLFPGNYLVLQNNGGDDEVIMGNGPFAFNTPIEDEQNYDVSIDLPAINPIQPCTLANEMGTVTGDDVTDVTVTCEPGDDLIFRDGFE